MKNPPPITPEVLGVSCEPENASEVAAGMATDVADAPSEPASSPDDSSRQVDLDSLETLLAEAESRGYKRGRNESISELMERPSDADPLLPDMGPEPQVLILNHLRPSIWDWT